MTNEKMVSISKGNQKMGAICSVSLPAIKTCAKCGCAKKCYAAKLERLRPSVKAAYERNYNILLSDPASYWTQVRAAVCVSRYFRFHVSGDIVDDLYFYDMILTAREYPGCDILCFTKRHDIVNRYLDTHADGIPKNLHVVFSGWTGYKMVNPHNLPEAHVAYKDGTTTARDGAQWCGGNCAECARTGCGCWTLKNGEQVIFMEH